MKSKLAKTVPKQELAEQYDNYIAQKAERLHSQAHTSEQVVKPAVNPKTEEEEESEEETIIVKKPKKKIKKKYIRIRI